MSSVNNMNSLALSDDGKLSTKVLHGGYGQSDQDQFEQPPRMMNRPGQDGAQDVMGLST